MSSQSKKIEFVSHRGNTNGINTELENRPEHVLELARLIKVEIDVWQIDGDFFLGHDAPIYRVTKDFLFNSNFLLHCKNLESVVSLSRNPFAEVFYQDKEDVVITNRGNRLFHSKSFEFGSKSSTANDYLVHLDKVCDQDIEFINAQIITDYMELNDFPYNSLLFDLLVLDIDGVMTDGKKIYDNSGQAVFKQFCDKDFTAIKRFKANGVEVCFLSADKKVNEEMANSRNVDFFFARASDGTIDKSSFLTHLKERYASKRICFVGDDYYDLTIISQVELSFCPSDASEIVKRTVSKVLSSKGGEGVVAELFSIFFEGRSEIFATDSI